ncbi:MAG: UDP-2,3-diacylglucosamine diphosphatase [Cytophagales bacterium]|nr:MAG: UDP-2,3-diacylglucosamine diphosphatase [Cytophagales bacterium]
MHYKTIIISDVHLGIEGSRSAELVHFLSQHTCDLLILNGDIIDAWELKKYAKWQIRHTRFFKLVFKMMQKDKTKVIYLHGNHDDFVDSIIPLRMGNFSFQMDYVLQSKDRKWYVVHGDVFDSVTKKWRWLAQIGSVLYNLLLWLNKFYNIYRKKLGLAPQSFSYYLKTRVKSIFSRPARYEQKLLKLTRQKECEGIICGHTHKPTIKQIEEIVYMNSGDWVESLTALLEDEEGNWQLYRYTDEHSLEFEKKKRKIPNEQEQDIDKIQSFFNS